MALPIKPTPKLNIKESEKFLSKVAKDLKKPAHFISTPKLASAKEKIISHAKRISE